MGNTCISTSTAPSHSPPPTVIRSPASTVLSPLTHPQTRPTPLCIILPLVFTRARAVKSRPAGLPAQLNQTTKPSIRSLIISPIRVVRLTIVTVSQLHSSQAIQARYPLSISKIRNWSFHCLVVPFWRRWYGCNKMFLSQDVRLAFKSFKVMHETLGNTVW